MSAFRPRVCCVDDSAAMRQLLDMIIEDFLGAEASMALMIFRTFDTYECPFSLVDYTIVVADNHVEDSSDHMLDGPSSDVS